MSAPSTLRRRNSAAAVGQLRRWHRGFCHANALLSYAYGEDFRYDEAMLTGAGIAGRLKAYAIASALGGFVTMVAIAPARWALTRFVLPAPGEGPSPQAQKNGFYDLRFLGMLGDGRTIGVKVTGDADPGYGSTCKMLAQAGLCLALDSKEKKTGRLLDSRNAPWRSPARCAPSPGGAFVPADGRVAGGCLTQRRSGFPVSCPLRWPLAD